MKVDKKNVQSDPRVTQELLLFQDKAIHKLRKKEERIVTIALIRTDNFYIFFF